MSMHRRRDASFYVVGAIGALLLGFIVRSVFRRLRVSRPFVAFVLPPTLVAFGSIALIRLTTTDSFMFGDTTTEIAVASAFGFAAGLLAYVLADAYGLALTPSSRDAWDAPPE